MTPRKKYFYKRPGRGVLPVALFLLLSCTGMHYRPALNYERATWFDIARATEQNLARLKTMRGNARMSFEVPNFSQTISAQIALKTPDSLSIKVEAVFGIDVALLMANADSVRIYSPFQKALYVARTDSLDFRRFFSVDLSYREFLGFLTGIEPVTDSFVVKRKDGKLICQIPGRVGVMVSYVDPNLGVVIRSDELNREGIILQRREYSRFEKKNGVIIPGTIRITRPHENQRITIFYTDLQINQRLSPKDFDIHMPTNIARIVL